MEPNQSNLQSNLQPDHGQRGRIEQSPNPRERSQSAHPQRSPIQRDAGRGRPRGWRSGMRLPHGRRASKVHVEHPTPNSRTPHTPIPEMAPDVVRIIPLGGVEEIGRNMTAVEVGNDIFILECGFAFSEESTPGIDFILPNTGYLEMNRNKIRGLLISHGHLDHIGAIPYVMDRIGNPPIYTRRLTATIIKKRQEEFAGTAPLIIREVETEEAIKLGSTTIRFFAVTHTIPDSMGIIIETAWGDVVFTGDIKMDHDDGVPTEHELKEFSIFKERKALILMMDSTNVERPGFSISERNVFRTLEDLISKNTRGRIIIGTFASQLERIMRIVRIAEEYGKKIVVDGRSMKTNIDIARELAILKHKDDTMVQIEDIDRYPANKLVILATGAQGDEFASLMRIANKAHKHIRINENDTLILSSSVIPGNERAVQKLKDNISRQGARIITYQTSDVHSSGHGNREESIWFQKQIRPKFFMPLHGYHYMLRVHADIAESIGMPPENIIVPDNSAILEIKNGETIKKLAIKAPAELRVVEGNTVTELSDVLMRDRKALGQEGFCVVVATIDRRTGKLHKSPDIISRGFVYLRDNKELMDQTRLIIRKSVEFSMRNMRVADLDSARDELAENVARFLLSRTMKRPIVIPVIVSV